MRKAMPAFVAGVVVGAIALWALQHTAALDNWRLRQAMPPSPPGPASSVAPEPSYQLKPEHVDVHYFDSRWDDRFKMMVGGHVSGTLRNPHIVGFDNVEIVVQSRSGTTITFEVGYVEPRGRVSFREDKSVFANPRVIRVRGTPVP